MSRPTGRVLALLELLQSGGTRTVAELADRLDVDGRTVRRYVDQLIDLDLPVESVRGRYGGYRLAPGYRLPPLMLTEDEALAVLLGLLAGRQTGLATTDRTASETASAKIRRVLPQRTARRLDALRDSMTLTGQPAEPEPPDASTLLTLADAVRHHRPVLLRYVDRTGRRSERTLHASTLVAHAGRWYVTGMDVHADGERTLRLDRIADARTLPGTFDPPPQPAPADHLLRRFATAGYRHEITLRIRGTFDQIRAHLPASVATLTRQDDAQEHALPAEAGAGASACWWRADLRADRLDWIPPVLAGLDLPFVVERPDELRELITALADRLASSARQT